MSALAISRLIARLGDPDYATGKALVEQLIELGEPVVAPLLAAELSPLARQRAVRTLGKLGDPRAVGYLVTLLHTALSENAQVYADADLTAELYEALTELATQLASAPTTESLGPLITLTRQLRGSHPQAALLAARGLRTLAITHPTPELRQALPALKGSFLEAVPFEFHAIRREIERATAQWKDLPLAAAAPQVEQDLPRPTSEPGPHD